MYITNTNYVSVTSQGALEAILHLLGGFSLGVISHLSVTHRTLIAMVHRHGIQPIGITPPELYRPYTQQLGCLE